MKIWSSVGNRRRKIARAAVLAALAATLMSCVAGGGATPQYAPAATASSAPKTPEQALMTVPNNERELRSLAQGGNAVAAAKLGLFYQTGLVVTKNLDEAIKWFRLGAEGGNPIAENALGFMYRNGIGLPQDYAEALIWFRKGVAQEYSVAQNNLGAMYESGLGVPVDHDEAARLFQLSAHQGYWLGAYNLGSIYQRGLGVEQNNSLAYFWLVIGTSGATGNVAQAAAKVRDAVAALLSPEEVNRIQQLAHDWKPNGDGAALLANAGLAAPAHGAAASKPGGMGVIVSKAGHILTNAHLVRGCQQVTVQVKGQTSVTVGIVGQDTRNDLALLKAPAGFADSAAFHAAHSISQGTGVSTFNGTLATGTLATGTVSAVTGANNDTRFLQISGASTEGAGGPVIDDGGNLVGITTNEVNGKSTAGLGLSAQSVQLAIKGSVARDFLDANSVDYQFGTAAQSLSAADMSERARKFTVQVACGS